MTLTAPAPEVERLLASVFDGLDRAGVRWVLLRGRSTLGVPGGDVDLLVDGRHLDSFEDVVLERGAFVLPSFRLDRRRRPSWHRFYVLTDPASGVSVKLDVVTRLVYGRGRQVPSGLETGCLERRVDDGGVQVLDPTDAFWTVLLHCLLDKGKVNEPRAADLAAVVDRVRRPSEGEEFFQSLCPESDTAEQALTLVRRGDRAALGELGARMLGTGTGTGTGSAPAGSGGSGAASSSAVRRLAEATYPVLWRRVGLGVVPRVLDLVEDGSVEGTVLSLRRRPALCDVLLLTPAEQRDRLAALLRADRYVPAGGRWHRLTGHGLERVRLVDHNDVAGGDSVRTSSLPVAGRTTCRRAVPVGG